MPTFGRAENGKWHIIGPDGCRYGRAFADDADAVPDETVSATDIVAYDPPDLSDRKRSRLASAGFLGGTQEFQRLVLPREIRDTDTGLCNSCRSQLETQQKRRSRLITDFKRVTPVRNVEWTRTEHDSLRVCYWCRAHEPTVWESEALDSRVCPACGRLYNSPLGDTGSDNALENDRRPVTPTDFVTPILIGMALPEYDPTELVGSNRPIIEVREGHKYATLKLDLERTGHAFTPEAIEALRSVRVSYAAEVAEDAAHQTDVTLNIGMTARSVTLDGVYPDDGASVIGDCWETVGDPDNWFRTGWSQYGRYGPPVERSVPGDDPVADAFPRLQTQAPAASVDTDSLEHVTDPGRYQRGERYYHRGAVTDLDRVDDWLQATVQGSQPYDVRVRINDGRFVDGECSCPDDAVPCKHIVAAFLASGDVEPVGDEQALEAVVRNATREDLETFLLNVAEADLTLRKQMYEKLQK